MTILGPYSTCTIILILFKAILITYDHMQACIAKKNIDRFNSYYFLEHGRSDQTNRIKHENEDIVI